MTPEEARALLDGTTPGPWEWASGKDSDVEYDALRGPGGVNALRTQDAEEYASWICGTNADKALAAAAPTLAAMRAEMREEWRVEFQAVDDKKWYPLTDWASGEPDRRPWNVTPTRLVRRYVTPTEEIK